jgi:hypothetical protein
MKRISNMAVGLGLALASVSAAWAGAGTTTTSVTPLSDRISYTESQTDPFFIVYSVSVMNEVGNTINNIVFTGATSPGSALATFESASGATCTTTNADRTAISCSIGQLKAGQSAPTFYVTFRAPAAATGTTAISFNGITFYAEGTGGPNSVPQNSKEAWPVGHDVVVSLGTTSPNNIKSGVPQVNRTLKFATAPNSVDAELSDQITMTVNVPGTAPITSTLTILDEPRPTTDTSCIAQGNFYRCYDSTLTIPDFVYPSGSGKYLGITLRIDPAAIKPGLKTSKVAIKYEDNTVPACQVTSPSGATIVTYATLPCYTGITYYKNWTRNSPWPQAWEGSLDVFLVNDENGRWTVE